MVTHISVVTSEPEGYEAHAYNQTNMELVKGFGALPSAAIQDLLVQATFDEGGSVLDGEVDPKVQD